MSKAEQKKAFERNCMNEVVKIPYRFSRREKAKIVQGFTLGELDAPFLLGRYFARR